MEKPKSNYRRPPIPHCSQKKRVYIPKILTKRLNARSRKDFIQKNEDLKQDRRKKSFLYLQFVNFQFKKFGNLKSPFIGIGKDRLPIRLALHAHAWGQPVPPIQKSRQKRILQ
jgi:hypothetical protein